MSILRNLRIKKGLSQSALAELVGTSQPQIRRLEAGERKLTKEWAERIAPHLGVTPEMLIFEKKTEQLEVIGLPIMGIVRAGDWRDISILDAEEEREVIHVARDPRFPHAKQYALLVSGDSMNLRFPDGCYVTCVDFAGSGLALKSGMIIHVERQMAGMQLVETTLKEVQFSGGKTLLVPRSTNSAHKPIVLSGGEDTEISVKGIVTGKFEPVSF
ncbi:LexA family transcriptional regulator [Chelativorans sp. Marseille-P2723]|uniref:LexA family protein n=1 Tax=Chelativorans sp. Marseille-P2723 TaxID=2709133 RepID=UPI0015713A61|nr:LexA family transcriptional regulator [Chelativorans sp. Marseille-P2723]